MIRRFTEYQFEASPFARIFRCRKRCRIRGSGTAWRMLEGRAGMRLDPQHGFLLEPRLVRLDDFAHGLLAGRIVRVREVQYVRCLADDGPIGAAPLARGLPDGEPLRKAWRDRAAQ